MEAIINRLSICFPCCGRKTNDNNYDMDVIENDTDTTTNSNQYEKATKNNDLPPNKTIDEMIAEQGFAMNWKLLGKGGYGFVYKAIDTKNDEVVACKTIDFNNNKNKSTREEIEKQKEREVNHELRVTQLEHKNIIKIRKYFMVNKCAYLMMELANGGSISTELFKRKKPYSEPVAKHYFTDILSGLYYLHSCYIVHHDLKPDNLLIFKPNGSKDLLENTIKICDFGISFVGIKRNGGYRKKAHRGTIVYMAPEVLLKNMQLSHNDYKYIYTPVEEQYRTKYGSKLEVNDPFLTDVWSLGVCLFKMVCNRLPFEYNGNRNTDTDKEVCEKKTILLKLQIGYHWKWPKHIYNKTNHSKTQQYKDMRDIIRTMLNPQPEPRGSTKILKTKPWVSDVNWTDSD